MKTIFRTVVVAYPADNASEPVNRPGPIRFTDYDCISRAVHTAYPAEDALFNFNQQVTPGERGLFCWNCRVPVRYGSMPDVPKNGPEHGECFHVHRSMHPIQGSIERTIIGTSAISHPFRIETNPGTFAAVGVLTR